jgi:hypothetical protein
MRTRLPAILFAVAVGGALSAAFFVALSRQPPVRTLVAGHPLQYWVQCLDSGEDDLREAARRNLPKFGVDAVGPLIERLDAESRAVSTASAAAIGKIPTTVTVPLLAASLRPGGADGRGGSSATPARRIKTIEVLAAMPAAASAPAIDDVARQLEDPDVCHTAADYVIDRGAGPHVIAVAARVLAGTEQYCRLQAIRVLCASPADPQVAPALVANMDCTDPAVRMGVWGALPTLPSVPPQAIERLCRGLADRQTRRISELLLFKAGPSAIDPLRWTRQRLGENDPQLRQLIADRIEQIRRAYPSTATSTLPTPPSVPLDFTLARTLEERRRLVDLLSYASDPAKYDLMIKALSDVDPGTRRAALVTMGRSLQSQRSWTGWWRP